MVNQVNSEQKKCLKGSLTCEECILTSDSAKSELKQLKKVKKKCIFSKSKFGKWPPEVLLTITNTECQLLEKSANKFWAKKKTTTKIKIKCILLKRLSNILDKNTVNDNKSYLEYMLRLRLLSLVVGSLKVKRLPRSQCQGNTQ